MVETAHGNPRKLVENGYSSSWSRDGRWIYYSRATHQAPQIFKVPATGGASRQVVITDRAGVSSTSDNIADPPRPKSTWWEAGNMPVESPDGRFLFFKDRDGVWRLPAEGGRAN